MNIIQSTPLTLSFPSSITPSIQLLSFGNTNISILSSNNISNIQDNKKVILQNLYQLLAFVQRQYDIASQALTSEKAAAITGAWEAGWGALTCMSEGKHFLFSKLAYTLTSLEELASAMYLLKNYRGYIDFLGKRILQIQSLIHRYETSSESITLNTLDRELIRVAKEKDYKQVIVSNINRDANIVVMGMQIFNTVILGFLSLLTLMGYRGHSLFRIPSSWKPHLDIVSTTKSKIFESIPSLFTKNADKQKHYGEILEGASISLPMGLLAIWKIALSRQSADSSLSNTLMAQGLAHIACFAEGLANVMHIYAGWSELFKDKIDAWLTYYSTITYAISSGNLLSSLISTHNEHEKTENSPLLADSNY